jgi:hypothetical protein
LSHLKLIVLYPNDVKTADTRAYGEADKQGTIGVVIRGKYVAANNQETYYISLRQRLRGIASDGLVIHKTEANTQNTMTSIIDLGCWTGSLQDAPLQLGWTWMHPSGKIAFRLVRFRRNASDGSIEVAYLHAFAIRDSKEWYAVRMLKLEVVFSCWNCMPQ